MQNSPIVSIRSGKSGVIPFTKVNRGAPTRLEFSLRDARSNSVVNLILWLEINAQGAFYVSGARFGNNNNLINTETIAKNRLITSTIAVHVRPHLIENF